MSKEKAKIILDKGLQRIQEFPWKDWDAEEVKKLIVEVKTMLNEEGRDETKKGKRKIHRGI